MDYERGYHVYKRSWTPSQGEILSVIHETGNAYDRHVIVAVKHSQIVGHLPKEISRIARFIMAHGAQASVTVLDDHHRRSPLIQGGLEIPVKLTVTMEYSASAFDPVKLFEPLIKPSRSGLVHAAQPGNYCIAHIQSLCGIPRLLT